MIDITYGLPIQGSKNKIAEKIIAQLPKADVLVDLFCGGGAITHCALLSEKYDRVIMNDINSGIVELFINAAHGKYKDEKRWISREDFFKLRDTDPYVKWCWSFSNNGRSYMYGKNTEPWKKALHYARFLGDTSLLKDMGINSDGSRDDIRAHADEYREKYITWLSTGFKISYKSITQRFYNLQSLQSLESLKRLQSLERLEKLERLQSCSVDYRDIDIPPNAVVYCDIPYRGTDCKGYKGFKHEEFYEWAKKRNDIFISEYGMPEPFIEYWSCEKWVLSNADGSHAKAVERIYTTQQTLNNQPEIRKKRGMIHE